MRTIRLDRAAWSAALTSALALGVLACGDDSANPTPSTGSGTFTTTGTGQTTSTGGEGGGGDGGGDGQGGGEGGGCTGDEGCYACEPTENDHFLDACTDSQCAPFDNDDRLPLYDGGELPPVP